MTKFVPLAFFIVMLTGLTGCKAYWPLSVRYSASEEVAKPLRIGVLQHPLSSGTIDSPGLEREILKKFAAEDHYKVQWVILKTPGDVLAALLAGHVDVGAARFNLDLAGDYSVEAGPSYQESPLSLVCPRVISDEDQPSSFWPKLFATNKHIPDSVKSIVALQETLSSNWQKRLERMYPGQVSLSISYKQSKDLLQFVAGHRSSCAVVDKTEAKYYLRVHPDLQIIQDLTPPISLGFLVNKDHQELKRQMLTWYDHAHRSQDFENLRDLYIGHLDALTTADAQALVGMMQERLPELIKNFQAIGREFHLPWQLIAAVAYQESHWDNDAQSVTGVRGFMMLTEDTADNMGILDRTDMQQSLWGGAKYLRYLLNKQPHFLSVRERLMFALASYNVGTGHVQDAQILAAKSGRDPQSWHDLKRTLPLLSYPEYYEQLQYGEARGQEPVDYAQRVLGFYEILSNPPPATL